MGRQKGVCLLLLVGVCHGDSPVKFGDAVPIDYRLINNANELHLGTTLPKTGSVSMIGRDFSYGMNLVFNKLNAKGGIAGAQIKFATLDDHYEPAVAVENVKTLFEKAPILFGLFGSESFGALYPKIRQDKLPLLMPFAGDVAFRHDVPLMLVHLRASLKQEIEALIGYAVEKMQRRKIAVFYEASRWGEGAVTVAEEILKRYGLSIYGKGSYIKNTVNVAKAASSIMGSEPDAILCIAHARPAYDFIKMTFSGSERSGGLQNCLFLGVGEMAPIQDIIDDARGIKLVLSSVVPSPWKSPLPIVKKFREDAKKYIPNRQISQPLLEGYIAASVLMAAIKKLGAEVTLGSLLNYFESLTLVNFGGLKLRFDGTDRTLCHNVWLNLGIDKPWPCVKPMATPDALTMPDFEDSVGYSKIGRLMGPRESNPLIRGSELKD